MIHKIEDYASNVLWSGEAVSLRDAVEKAVKAGARLDGARLVGARLDGASLDGASLVGARLDGASLDGASLVGARLDRASLDRARLDGASLDRASLVGARLDGASLDRARLDRARLDGASLDGASLVGARLDPIRDDFYKILESAAAEVPALIAALREGRVDGSTYTGECACLVGTIANIRHEPHNALSIALRPDSSRFAEVWFMAIKRGDTPTGNPVSAITVGWAEQWLRDQGREVPVHAPVFWRGDLRQLSRDLKAAGVDVGELKKLVKKGTGKKAATAKVAT